jgi:hypothetical protein
MSTYYRKTKGEGFNLVLRFLLELTALFTYGYWAWHRFASWKGILLAIVLPLAGAIIWGVFAVPNDPSRSGKTVIPTSGLIRLCIEICFFAFATFALYMLELTTLAYVFAAFVICHYVFSYKRIGWLLKQ